MKHLKVYDFIFIGAGASALMGASNLSKKYKILLIDANAKIGQKILISGGGKCNVVNEQISSQDYLGDEEFLKPLFENYSSNDILNFFNGIEFEKRKGGKYFTKHGAKLIVDFFAKKTKHYEFALNQKVIRVEKNDDLFSVFTDKNSFICKRLVVASGGLSYPKLNSSDIGYKIAENFGLKVTKTNPALVGLSLQKEQFWLKELSGVSVRAKVSVGSKTFYDDILFSHRGISGLAILNASLFWQKGDMVLDFLPDKNINSYLKDKNKQITSQLPLPKRFIKSFLANLNLEDKPLKKLTTNKLLKLQTIHNYTFAPAGYFGYTKAEVTKGGVSTTEIDSQTYECKHVKNLYFIGEVLDITGRLGGYNFYFAFSSALKMSENVEK